MSARDGTEIRGATEMTELDFRVALSRSPALKVLRWMVPVAFLSSLALTLISGTSNAYFAIPWMTVSGAFFYFVLSIGAVRRGARQSLQDHGQHASFILGPRELAIESERRRVKYSWSLVSDYLRADGQLLLRFKHGLLPIPERAFSETDLARVLALLEREVRKR